jgi:hypothetical protein
MNKIPTVEEEAGLGPNWVPLETQPIIPGQSGGSPPAPVPLGNYTVGSISPSLQHDATFVETAYGTPRIPVFPLMPISSSGLASTNSAIQNIINSSSSQDIINNPGGPNGAIQVNEGGSFYGDSGLIYNNVTKSVYIMGMATIGDGASISSPGVSLSAGNAGLISDFGTGVLNANVDAIVPGSLVLHYIETANQNTLPLVLGNAQSGSHGAGVAWSILDTGIDAGNAIETYYSGGQTLGSIGAIASDSSFRIGANDNIGGILELTDAVQIGISEAGHGKFGFFQTTPVVGPISITGDQQGNTALASLLTALGSSGYGFISDMTTNSGSASGFDFLLMGG